jgi:hypothetical protein
VFDALKARGQHNPSRKRRKHRAIDIHWFLQFLDVEPSGSGFKPKLF